MKGVEVGPGLEILREKCDRSRYVLTPVQPVMVPGELYMPTPVEVEVGGATSFVLNVERMDRV